MKIIRVVSLILVVVSLSGCGVVQRWTLNSAEAKSAQLPANRSLNVFYDYLWTTPDIESHPLKFDQNGGNAAAVEFGGRALLITRNANGQLSIGDTAGTSGFVSAVPSQENVYYDMDVLGTKVIPRERLVTKTRYVTRYESVQKTRMVTKMVPVQKSRSVPYTNASGTTSYRMEYYTVNEMQSVSESYWTMEPVRRMETYQEWETVYETFIDIPVYKVYTLPLGGEGNLLVYRIERDGTETYYVQNPQYIIASDPSGEWGGGDTRILAIDSNSNGIYFEDKDRIMFNSWNPYAQDSAYQNIQGFMDNYWYTVEELKEERFITIGLTANGSQVAINNANDQFVGSTETGHIYISNVPRKTATITINGRKYRQKRKGIFDEKIQYGLHRLRISYAGYPDYSTNFLIDAKTPSYRLDYKPAGRAGQLLISNNSFRNWKVAVIDGGGKLSLYEQESDINLAEGDYDVIVSSGGMEIKKEISISADAKTEIDVKQEIETLFGNIPEVEGVQEARPEDVKKVNGQQLETPSEQPPTEDDKASANAVPTNTLDTAK